MTKILLFGSTGMLGRYVYKVLSEKYIVQCITRNDFDIQYDSLELLYGICSSNLNENDIIINCAGIIPQKYLPEEFNSYIRTNTLFPINLGYIAKQQKYKFIHITTDCVFDGKKGDYSIYDKHTANDIYGVTKSLGENCIYATILRTSIIGEEIQHKKSLLEWVISNKGKTINGFTNHYWNGVTCLTIATIIKQIINDNLFWQGVRHIHSPDVLNKYELCKIINDVYELNIRINEYEDKITKNMTLTGDNTFSIPNIHNQIIEQKLFGI
jgi:dTDP-4-dehydrorhamnose reductase